jgi:hypothetical protein
VTETQLRLSRPDVEAAEVYAASAAAGIMRRRTQVGLTPRLACLDIDSTLTGPAELAGRVRTRLEEVGYVVAFVTSRTEEMIMSSWTYALSAAAGLRRPPPKLGIDGDRHVHVPPEDVVPAGLLDGEVIAGSSGTRILLRGEDGAYRPDPLYEEWMGADPDGWRAVATSLVRVLQRQGIEAEPAPIDRREAYETGMTDVYPPLYRVQVNFPSLAEKARFLVALDAARTSGVPDARAVRITDDSNPEHDRIKVFLTPLRGAKVRAVERMVGALCVAAGVPRGALDLFFAGDSFPDLAMGLFGGLGARATFLLAGGSRLVTPMVGAAEADFAGEPVGAYRRRLRAGDRPGTYHFTLPLGHGTRTVIVGDEMYPGTVAVETVARYVETLTGD